LKKIGIKEEISFLLSLLFAVNPMLTNAVAWIPARGDLLLCLFSLLTFITFLDYYATKKTILLILHTFVFLLAILSKETAILLPFLILLYFYFIQRNRFTLKNLIPILITWSLVIVFFFALRQSVLKVDASSNEFGIISFIKNLPTIPITLGKFFIPYNLSTIPLFDNTTTIIGIILIICLTVLIIKVRRGEKRIVIWGALWFLGFSIPPMFFRSYFATIGIDYFEYRTYLPIIGIFLIIGFLINESATGFSFRRMLIFSIPLLMLYSIIAFIHSEDFVDPFSFLTSAIKSSPNNALALQLRGTEYFNNGNYNKAMLDYDNSIRIFPTYSIPYYDKGLIYQRQKDYDRAEKSFSLALNYDTLDKRNNLLQEIPYLNLSTTKLFLKKYDEAILVLRKGISKYPNNTTLHVNLAIIYFYNAKFDSALDEYNRMIESGMVSPQFYNGRGMVKDSLKDYSGALADFNKALELKQDFIDALKNRDRAQARLPGFKEPVGERQKEK
jgi:protein O-mannosyl-transferase